MICWALLISITLLLRNISNIGCVEINATFFEELSDFDAKLFPTAVADVRYVQAVDVNEQMITSAPVNERTRFTPVSR